MTDLTPAEIAELPRLLAENERLRAAVGLEARDRIVSASPGELLIDRNGHQRIRVGLMQEEQVELVRLRAELAEAVRIIVEMIETEEHPPLIKHEFTRSTTHTPQFPLLQKIPTGYVE